MSLRRLPALRPRRWATVWACGDFDIPNVLRVVIGECRTEAAAGGAHRKIEANIDDMSPEAYEPPD